MSGNSRHRRLLEARAIASAECKIIDVAGTPICLTPGHSEHRLILEYNENHDEQGQFASGGGSESSGGSGSGGGKSGGGGAGSGKTIVVNGSAHKVTTKKTNDPNVRHVYAGEHHVASITKVRVSEMSGRIQVGTTGGEKIEIHHAGLNSLTGGTWAPAGLGGLRDASGKGMSSRVTVKSGTGLSSVMNRLEQAIRK